MAAPLLSERSYSLEVPPRKIPTIMRAIEKVYQTASELALRMC